MTVLTIDRAEVRVRWALDAVPGLLHEPTIGVEEMWVLAHGFCNAFYTVGEILASAAKNTPERRAHEEWRIQDKGGEEMHFLLNKFRNRLTHQDAAAPSPVVTWEVDPLNDTQHPVQSYPYIELVPLSGGPSREFTFRQWVEYCFGWLRDQLKRIRERYERILSVEAATPQRRNAHP